MPATGHALQFAAEIHFAKKRRRSERNTEPVVAFLLLRCSMGT